MSEQATGEQATADWCVSDGQFAMSGTHMKEHSRQAEGGRWCFRCHARSKFFYVVDVPDGISYYGPSPSIRCGTCDQPDADLFPGRIREWE